MSAQNEYEIWMNTKQPVINATMSPSAQACAEIREEFKAATGSDNYYDNRDLWEHMYDKACVKFTFTDMSLKEAQAILEHNRIANPDQNVSLSAGKSYIGNVTWNDQMKMFWEYETYTEQGAKLAAARKAECDALGLIAAWS